MIKMNYFLFLLLILLTPISVVAKTKTIDKLTNLDSQLKQNIHSRYFRDNSLILDDRESLITLSDLGLNNLVKIIKEHYFKKKCIANFSGNFTFKQALNIQKKFINFLLPNLGELIGYKAGLTNKKIQNKFNTNQPVLGSLLERMLLPSGTTVPAKFGAVPMLEGDLMVRVKSEEINTAKTTEEALKYLDAVIPFLELPDLMYAKELKLNKEMLVAINVGARLGITGTPIPLEATEEWQNKLSNIQVTIIDESGQELGQGNSKALLGDPLKVVLWIKYQLKSQGKNLKKGDLLSLGSITPLIPVKAGTTISALYIGLDQDSPVEISVYFEE